MRDDGVKRVRCGHCGKEHWCWAWQCPNCKRAKWGYVEHPSTAPKSWDEPLAAHHELPEFLRGAPARDVAAWCGFDLVDDGRGRVLAIDASARFDPSVIEVSIVWVEKLKWVEGEGWVDESRWWVVDGDDVICPLHLTIEEFDDWLSWRELEPAHDHQAWLDTQVQERERIEERREPKAEAPSQRELFG